MDDGDVSDGAADVTLTIEQVAAGAGIPVSTVRMYQHRGLLAPPVKRGRVGYYGPDHEERLRLIAELQERGFSLAGIKELVDGWAEGRSLDEVLGLSGDRGIWAAEEPVVIDVADLVQRFNVEEVTPELMQRVTDLGLAELTDDGRLRVTSPRFLEIGSRLGDLGVPAAEVIDEYEVLRAATDEIADRFTALFVRRLWEPMTADGITAADVERITETLGQLGQLAQAVVDLTLAQAVQQRAREFLDEQAAALAGTAAASGARTKRAAAARRRSK
jgi:DNA-binding transcriptional MerR regulator